MNRLFTHNRIKKIINHIFAYIFLSGTPCITLVPMRFACHALVLEVSLLLEEVS